MERTARSEGKRELRGWPCYHRCVDILVSGTHGLIGSALVTRLRGAGHRITPLVRRKPLGLGNLIGWNPETAEIESGAMEGFDAVVHLAGENIAGRWTAAKQARIRASRVEGTRLLSDTLTRLARPPRVLVAASAVGFYGNRGDEVLTESGKAGNNFLAEVTQAWEAATLPAAHKGIRVVNLRFGMVLTPAGGALAKMLPAFRCGFGGPVGNGRQFWPWLSLEDATGIIEFALNNESLAGPANAVAPHEVTCREFVRSLGRALHRPALLPLPAFVARLLLGRMADETLLASARARPEKLLQAGYSFHHAQLEAALRAMLEGK